MCRYFINSYNGSVHFNAIIYIHTYIYKSRFWFCIIVLLSICINFYKCFFLYFLKNYLHFYVQHLKVTLLCFVIELVYWGKLCWLLILKKWNLMLEFCLNCEIFFIQWISGQFDVTCIFIASFLFVLFNCCCSCMFPRNWFKHLCETDSVFVWRYIQ